MHIVSRRASADRSGHLCAFQPCTQPQVQPRSSFFYVWGNKSCYKTSFPEVDQRGLRQGRVAPHRTWVAPPPGGLLSGTEPLQVRPCTRGTQKGGRAR